VSPYFTQKLESAFHSQLPDFNFKVQSAQLIWGGHSQPFEIEIKDLEIDRDDGSGVLDVRRLRVQLSKRNLVFGRIAPRIVKIFGPVLQVIRREDGSFALNVGDAAEAEKVPDTPEAELPSAESRAQLIKSFLDQLQKREGLGFFDGLQQIDITDAGVIYEDRLLKTSWRSAGADITAARGPQGLVAHLVASVSIGGRKAGVKADISYDWAQRKTAALIGFSDVVPAALAQQSDVLKPLADVNLPVTGSLGFDLDDAFRPKAAQFSLLSEAGTFNALGLYEAPIPVKSLFLHGKADLAAGMALIDDFRLDLDGPTLKAGLKIETEGAARNISFTGVLFDMPMDDLKHFWPPGLAADAQSWVTHHLSKGIATRATIDLDLAYDAAAEHPVTVKSLGGKIDYKDITVDYMPPLQPVTGASGTAEYGADHFTLHVTGGKLLDMNLQKSEIRILDLDPAQHPQGARIEIEDELSGPLKTALKVLDSPPLGYPEKLGLKSAEVAGEAKKLKLSFKFPLHKSITMHDVAVTADAVLDEVLLKDVVAGMDLTGGPFDLHVDNDALKAEGKAKLAGMPVDFTWQKFFSDKAPLATTLEASLPLDAAALKKFGLPETLDFNGTMPAKVSYKLAPDKTAKLNLKGDLTPAAFDIPLTGAGKNTGAAGSIAFDAALRNGTLEKLSNLALKTPELSASGTLDFVDGALRKADLPTVTMGQSTVAVTAAADGKGGYDASISGRQLDASSLFTSSAEKNSDAEAAKIVPPLRLKLDVAHILTGKEKTLERVKATLVRNKYQRIDALDLTGLAGGKDLSVQYQPVNGGHSLQVNAVNAGAALAALGITKSIRGGVLSINARPLASGPRDLGGTAILSDFKLNDAPTVATLLNAMSLGGMIDLLNGEGLNFKKARVDFTWKDRGQPGQAKNERLLTLKDGQTSGASLGLSFEGHIDNWANTYDLNGTIVPVSGINKFLSVIPILGNVLTANGEGVIAATYTITGPKEKPNVSVNPLSVLAPGILRKIFFEK